MRKTKSKHKKQRVRKPVKVKSPVQSIRRVKARPKFSLPCYVLNRDFEFIQELRDLVLKSSPTEKTEIFARLQKLGKIKLAVVTGIFLNKENNENIPTDLFIVADDLDRRKFSAFLKFLEAETGGEVRFVIMEKDEFQYRFSMFDRFVRVLLEGPHEKLINRLGI